MRENTIRNLCLLLALQVALALAAFALRPGLSGAAPSAALLDVAAAAVEQMLIDGGGKSATLRLQNKNWTLPQLDGFAADQGKVLALVQRLTTLKRGLPLTTSSASWKRFKLADDGYERRIVLSGGGKTLATIFVGSVVDARRAHVRVGGDDAVYAVELPSFDLPVTATDWEDKAVLQVPVADITSIDLGPLALERTTDAANAGWRASAGLAAGRQLDTSAVDRLADLLAHLTIAAPLGTAVKSDFEMDSPALTLTIKRKDGSSVEYLVGKKRASGDYVVKASLRPEYFSVPGYALESLLEAARPDRLVQGAAARPAG